MIKSRLLLTVMGLAVLLAVAAVACGDSAEPASEPEAQAPAAAQETSDAASQPSVAAAPVPVVEPSPTAEPVAEPSPTAEPSLSTGRTGEEKLAPELAGITGWVNSEPFKLEDHRGDVVLIDFWTYTCINCIRTFPYLKEWHEKYADEGLVIVGVHTPEFEFEKERDNVVEAAGKHGLRYAIAQDNDFATWRAFSNRFWPAKYLIDKDGYIRYQHFGEGAYTETEEKIRELLAETGSAVAGIEVNRDPERQLDPQAFTDDRTVGLTRELYAGYERNFGALSSGTIPPYVLHEEYYRVPDVDTLYEDPGNHRNHFLYLQGLWHNGPESLMHARETANYEDYIALKFFGTSVNTVMKPVDGTPVVVRLMIDGKPLEPTQAGADVMFDEEGNSFVLVDEPKMYRVVNMPEFGGHELTLSSNSPEFSLFAFTFGAFQEQAGS